MGRWINRDIFEGNDLDTLYLFVSNKSIIHTDYLGLLFGGDNCKVGTMRNFKPYVVAKDALRHYSFDSPDDEERYALSVSMIAKISELAPTSGGAGKKIAKQLVKKNKDMVDEMFEAISDIKKDIGKNAFYIVVWYKFEAECCKCNKGFFYTTYDFEKVETEWEVYPKRKSRRDNSTSEKFLKANVMEHYAKVLKDKLENMCK